MESSVDPSRRSLHCTMELPIYSFLIVDSIPTVNDERGEVEITVGEGEIPTRCERLKK